MSDRVQEVSAKVIELAAEHGGVPVENVARETHFVNDLKYDSLQMVEFTMDLEDELELSISDEDASGLMTVGAVIDYILKHVPDGGTREGTAL